MIEKIAGCILENIVVMMMLGYLTAMMLTELTPAILTRDWGRLWNPGLLLKPAVQIYGAVVTVTVYMLYLVFYVGTIKRAKRLMKAREDSIESSLENLRFIIDKEKDNNFSPERFVRPKEEKKDEIPVYTVYNRKEKGLNINVAKPIHDLIIGATDSDKTISFINPMIQILGRSSAGSSMICTDPKGKLFQLHSGMLAEQGYRVMVLDLGGPYSSFHWNLLGDIYDRYQLYLKAGQGTFQCDTDVRQDGLGLVNGVSQYRNVWCKYKGRAYAVHRELLTAIEVERQKMYDGIYENLNDLISVVRSIESQDNPVWEKGAHPIIMAVCLAMLEDNEYPELEVTKEKFCFYDVNRAVNNLEDKFRILKEYFMGRLELSKPVGLSGRVPSAVDTILTSYISIAFDRLSMFNDEGLRSLTPETDVDPQQFAAEPMTLFLEIPDKKDVHHVLTTVFVLCTYKVLTKVVSAREDLSLPRDIHFILDGFGNIPKINRLDKMITVGRSHKVWFNMVVQPCVQLDSVYRQTISNIIKSNCGLKMFIGSNGIEICEEFSKLCGSETVSTQSVPSTLGDKTENIDVSGQVQTRPLIYPPELQKLNNKNSIGDAIIITFGNYPLKTRPTPSYRYPFYGMRTMNSNQVQMNVFFGDEVYYDLDKRNYIIAGRREKEVKVSAE